MRMAGIRLPNMSLSLGFLSGRALVGAGLRLAAGTASASRPSTRLFSSVPDYTAINIPALSPTMTEGVIANWLRNEGDAVEAGQPICEIETDKATVDFEVQDDGFLAKILVPAGSDPMKVGTAIGIIVEDKQDVAAFANFTLSDLTEEPKPAASKEANEFEATPIASAKVSFTASNNVTSESASTGHQETGSRVFASPLARMIASENGIDINSMPPGSGPNGRIIRNDVESYIANSRVSAPQVETAEKPQPPSTLMPSSSDTYFDLPTSTDAQTLALQLEKSKRNVPHYYLNSEIDLTNLLKLREQLNEQLADDEKIAVNDFFVRAAAICMANVPEVNSSWAKSFIRRYKNVDINVAVVTPTEEDIIAPVIRNADSKRLSAISQESRAMLSSDNPQDLGFGTFTISNMGAFGLKTFTPIVREPQACSLGIGKITGIAVPGSFNEETKQYNVKIVSTVTVTLSCDHRVVDGAVGAKWLQNFKQTLENPLTMLL